MTTHATRCIGGLGCAAAAAVVARRARARGNSFDQNESSKHASAGTMVSQFRKERLPPRISVTWNRTIITPAMCRAMRG